MIYDKKEINNVNFLFSFVQKDRLSIFFPFPSSKYIVNKNVVIKFETPIITNSGFLNKKCQQCIEKNLFVYYVCKSP